MKGKFDDSDTAHCVDLPEVGFGLTLFPFHVTLLVYINLLLKLTQRNKCPTNTQIRK